MGLIAVLFLMGFLTASFFVGKALGKKEKKIPNILTIVYLVGTIYFSFFTIVSFFMASFAVNIFFAYLFAIFAIGWVEIVIGFKLGQDPQLFAPMLKSLGNLIEAIFELIKVWTKYVVLLVQQLDNKK